jgi:hypothetical protein
MGIRYSGAIKPPKGMIRHITPAPLYNPAGWFDATSAGVQRASYVVSPAGAIYDQKEATPADVPVWSPISSTSRVLSVPLSGVYDQREPTPADIPLWALGV